MGAPDTPSRHLPRLVLASASPRRAALLDLLGLAYDVDPADAGHMLRDLSGRTHEVHTAVVVRLADREVHHVDTTRVRFVELTDHEIAWYVATGEPLDKAGAYGIQGAGGAFVAAVDGNVHNVIGLSLATVHDLVRRLGFDLFDWAR